MATDDNAVIPHEPITPRFQDVSPLLNQILPPLTAEQDAEVNRLMTETPEYQSIMEDCRQIKKEVLEAAATAIAYIEALRDGKIPEKNIELAHEVVLAASQAAREGKKTLEEISKGFEKADLPPGDCALNTSNPRPLTAPER